MLTYPKNQAILFGHFLLKVKHHRNKPVADKNTLWRIVHRKNVFYAQYAETKLISKGLADDEPKNIDFFNIHFKFNNFSTWSPEKQEKWYVDKFKDYLSRVQLTIPEPVKEAPAEVIKEGIEDGTL